MTAEKSVVIVGPGEHFGFQLAKQFGEKGFHVVLVARKKEALQELSEKVQAEGISSDIVVADVSNIENFGDAFTAVASRIPPVMALIFNVKASVRGDGLTLSPEQLTEALAIQVSGVLVAVQTVLPYFAPGASVMLTGGGYKDTPDPEKLALSVSKGALHTLFLALVEPLSARGIKVGTVIIDGVVRAEGPIFPEDVAQAFLEVSESETGKAIMVSS
jgi:short-subunit dehydrogenase